ncbi:ATP-dependent helicase/nuclease subunit B [Alphaproteobacteria bacterium]
MRGTYRAQNRNLSDIHEDSSTRVMQQFVAKVEFRKKSSGKGSVFNIPLSSAFIDSFVQYFRALSLTQSDFLDAVFISPGKRVAHHLTAELYKLYSCEKNIITYTEIADNIHLFVNAKQKYRLPQIISKRELTLFLYNILDSAFATHRYHIRHYNTTALVRDLKLALYEYYYYSLLPSSFSAENRNEALFLAVLKLLEDYLANKNLCLDPQRLNLAIEFICSNAPGPRKIYAILPVLMIPYINKFLSWAHVNVDLKLFIHGLDYTLPDEAWNALRPEHCQYHIKAYLDRIKLRREDVVNIAQPRSQDLDISQLMYPPDMVQQWHKRGKNCFDNVRIISASSTLIEAENVVNALEKCVNSSKYDRIGVVTSDLVLAKCIYNKLQLADWVSRCRVKYSIPTSLADYPEIKFFMLLLSYSGSKKNELLLLSDILKHQCSLLFNEHLELVWQFEISYLQKFTPSLLVQYFDLMSCEERGLYSIIHQSCIQLEALRKAFYAGKDVSELCNMHFDIFLNLLAGNYRNTSILDVLRKIINDISLFSGHKNVRNYKELINALLYEHKHHIDDGNNFEKGLEITTNIEARFNNYDLIIACGLQDGIFPETKGEHYHISSDVRVRHRYDPPMLYEIGYVAHDFCNILSYHKVILSYCTKQLDNTRAMPTRWLSTLWAYMQLRSKQYGESSNEYKKYSVLGSIVDVELGINDIVTPRNTTYAILGSAANPPLYARPVFLSASAVEKLMRNPYKYYTEYILNLKPMQIPVDRKSLYMEFGLVLHGALANINRHLLRDCRYFDRQFYTSSLRDYCKKVLAELFFYKNVNEIYAVWLPKINNIANWLFEKEQELKCAYNIIDTMVEQRGYWKYRSSNNLDIRIEAKFDRVDVDNAGMAIITDYKTGHIPPISNIHSGRSPQLPIEALILREGTLLDKRNIPMTASAIKKILARYLRITGRREIGEEKYIDINVENVKTSICNLVELFYAKKQSYHATSDFMHSCYGHFSRIAENIEL